MSVFAILAQPVPGLFSTALRRVASRIVQRWHEARDTTALEIVLFGFSVVIGGFFVAFPNGYREGWSMLAALELWPWAFGVVKLVEAVFRAVSIDTGNPRLRVALAWFGFLLDGTVVGMVWAGNHFSPVVPYAVGLPLMNLYVMGRFAKRGRAAS